MKTTQDLLAEIINESAPKTSEKEVKQFNADLPEKLKKKLKAFAEGLAETKVSSFGGVKVDESIFGNARAQQDKMHKQRTEEVELEESDSRWKLYAQDKEKGYTCHHVPASEAKPGENRFRHTLKVPGKEDLVIHSISKYYPHAINQRMNEEVALDEGIESEHFAELKKHQAKGFKIAGSNDAPHGHMETAMKHEDGRKITVTTKRKDASGYSHSVSESVELDENMDPHYRAGMMAAYDGKTAKHNPHDKMSMAHKLWKQGHKDNYRPQPKKPIGEAYIEKLKSLVSSKKKPTGNGDMGMDDEETEKRLRGKSEPWSKEKIAFRKKIEDMDI